MFSSREKSSRDISFPFILAEPAQPGIARYFRMNPGQVENPRQRHRFPVKLGAADDEGRFGAVDGGDIFRQAQRILKRAQHFGALGLVISLAGNDDVAAAGQRPADGFPGLAPHDDAVPHGRAAKMAQVFRQAPGQPVVVADDSIARHGADQGKFHGRRTYTENG